MSQKTYTTGEAALLLGVPAWRVSGLFTRGLLPEPPRVGPYRVLTEELVEQIREIVAAQIARRDARRKGPKS